MSKTLAVQISGTGFQDMAALAQCLPSKTSLQPGDQVVFHFGQGHFVFLTGLNLLATWRKSLPAGVSASVEDSKCHEATKSLLTNCGFREVIETGHENPSAQARIGRLPLRPLTSPLGKEATIREMTSMLAGEFPAGADMTPFSTLLSELCENALTHSEFASPGYVCARTIDRDATLELAVCDSGIGFRNSYMLGTNAEAKERISRGANPIEVAFEGLNSSKPTRATGSAISYYGFGLYLTRRLVEENRGRMIVISGSDGLQIEGTSRRHISLNGSFPGSFVGVVLNLRNPLPLEEIYEQATEMYVGPAVKVPTPTATNSGVAVQSQPGSSLSRQEANNPVSGDAILHLQHYGTELLTRETGLAVRAEIATLLLKYETVVVKLDGVADLTPSVADEAFAKLAETLGNDVFSAAVRFDGGTSLVNRLIEFVIKTRSKRGQA